MKRLKKKEEKKLHEEAEKEKMKKKSERFQSFFKKNDVVKEGRIHVKEAKPVAEGAPGNFTLFRLKDNMRLAPTVRNNPEVAKKRIDSLDMPSGPGGLYLALLKTNYVPGKQLGTWPHEKNVPKDDDEKEDDVKGELKGVLVKAKVSKVKLLQFHSNRRHAYWGTWTKKSKFVSGRYGLFYFISI